MQQRLKDVPRDEAWDKLNIGYGPLEDVAKGISLHTACFLKYEKKSRAIYRYPHSSLK